MAKEPNNYLTSAEIISFDIFQIDVEKGCRILSNDNGGIQEELLQFLARVLG